MDRIISRRPGAVVRFTMPILLVMLAVVSGSGFLIRYPQTVNAKASHVRTDSSGSLLYAESRIKRKYLNSICSKDSIDIVFRNGLARKNVSVRVKFDTVASRDPNDDPIIRLFFPRHATNLTLPRAGTYEGSPEILISLGRRSLRSIIF